MKFEEEVNPIVAMADMFIKDCVNQLSPLYREEHGTDQDVPVQLFASLHSTSESILVLLVNGAIFDADVLLRTLMEGTIKYCYLMIGSPEDRHQKYNEYKYKLTEIDKMQDHQKAEEAISILREFSLNSTKPFETMLLSDEELKRLKSQYSNKRRNEIKNRWSYQSILRSLAKTNLEYKAELATLSTYALTSHLAHYDWTGLSMRQSQLMNSAEESSQISDIAHAIRIADNVLAMYIFRVTEYMRGNKFMNDGVASLLTDGLAIIEQLGKKEDELIDMLM